MSEWPRTDWNWNPRKRESGIACAVADARVTRRRRTGGCTHGPITGTRRGVTDARGAGQSVCGVTLRYRRRTGVDRPAEASAHARGDSSARAYSRQAERIGHMPQIRFASLTELPGSGATGLSWYRAELPAEQFWTVAVTADSCDVVGAIRSDAARRAIGGRDALQEKRPSGSMRTTRGRQVPDGRSPRLHRREPHGNVRPGNRPYRPPRCPRQRPAPAKEAPAGIKVNHTDSRAPDRRSTRHRRREPHGNVEPGNRPHRRPGAPGTRGRSGSSAGHVDQGCDDTLSSIEPAPATRRREPEAITHVPDQPSIGRTHRPGYDTSGLTTLTLATAP